MPFQRLVLAIGVFGTCAAVAQQPSNKVDFAREVHPLLVAKCGGCHSGARGQAGLSVNTRAELLKGGANGAAIVPGNAKSSLLLQRVNGGKLPLMPLGGKLSDSEIATLERWIAEGAAWDADISAQTKPAVSPLDIRKPAPPPAANPVDALLGLKDDAPLVGAAQFARRAYFDLHGLPPRPEELDAFLAERGDAKRTRLIERLLDDRQPLAEHWVSFWNDLLHNDEGVTYIGDRKTITPWLLKALKENLRYDDFVRALLNPAREGDPQGFLIGVNWRGDVNASQTPVMQAAQNSAQVFLGINLKCNSCHDSFISHWKLKEAYGLASFFTDSKLEIAKCDVPTGQYATAGFLFPELGAVDPQASLDERRKVVAELFTKKENGLFAKTIVNRVWRKLMGRGLVEPLDIMESPAFNEPLLHWLAADFIEHQYDFHHLLKRIMTSRAYQLKADPNPPAKDKPFVFHGPQVRRLDAEQFIDSISAVTGEWRTLTPNAPGAGVYAREWRLKATQLTLALGRPMRDFAVTERLNDPTTLQTLELVNGKTLSDLLRDGAKRMLDEARPAPPNLYDSGVQRSGNAVVKVEADVSGQRELRLLAIDHDSYDPSRVAAGWAGAELLRADGTIVPLSSLQPKSGAAAAAAIQFPKRPQAESALRVAFPSEVVYDIAGKGFVKFRATAGVDQSSVASDINPALRFFVFGEPPDMRRLVKVQGETPQVRPPVTRNASVLIDRIWKHALARKPSAEEQKLALDILGAKPNADGLEDLLWMLFISPEFQYVM